MLVIIHICFVIVDQTTQQSLTEGKDKGDIIFELETELMNPRAEMSEKEEHISTFQLKLTGLIQEYKYISPVKGKDGEKHFTQY